MAGCFSSTQIPGPRDPAGFGVRCTTAAMLATNGQVASMHLVELVNDGAPES